MCIRDRYIEAVQYQPDTLNTGTLLFNSKGRSLKSFQTKPTPVYKSHVIIGDEIHISFEHLDGQLLTKNKYGYVNGFSIIRKGSQPKPIRAEVINNKIVLPYPNAIARDRIRYLKNGRFNLYNATDQPIRSFHFIVNKPK